MAKLGMLKNIQSHTGTQDRNAVTLTVKDIPIGDIRIQGNVRTEYTEIKELAESIRIYGLLQPITVYADKEGYIVKTGHRRFMAYKMLYQLEPERFHSIRCVISNDYNIVLIQLIENVQRVDLSQVDLFNTLNGLKTQGMTLKRIAEVMGKSEKYIKNLFVGVNEINNNPELQTFISSPAGGTIQDISETKSVKNKQERKAILENRKDGKMSRAEMRKKVKELTATKPQKKETIKSNHQVKQRKIHVSIKAFPSQKKIIIYQVKSEGIEQLASMEKDLREYFIENKGKYFIVKIMPNKKEA